MIRSLTYIIVCVLSYLHYRMCFVILTLSYAPHFLSSTSKISNSNCIFSPSIFSKSIHKPEQHFGTVALAGPSGNLQDVKKTALSSGYDPSTSCL